MAKGVSCGFSEWTTLCHCGLIKLQDHQALVVASHTEGDEGVWWSQSLAFPQKRAIVVAERKDSGALFSVPNISENASRWSRDILSLANYPNGWADRTLRPPARAQGSWISSQFWPSWPAVPQHSAFGAPPSSTCLGRLYTFFLLRARVEEGLCDCCFIDSLLQWQILLSVREKHLKLKFTISIEVVYMTTWKMFYFCPLFSSCKQCIETSLVSSVSTRVFVNLSWSCHGRLFLFLPSSGLLSISAEHWWHSTYKCNLCRSLLVPFHSTAFSCPPRPTQVFTNPRSAQGRRAEWAGHIHHPNDSKHKTCWRWVRNTRSICKVHHTLYALPSLSPHTAKFYTFAENTVSFLSTFSTSLKLSQSLALPSSHTITSRTNEPLLSFMFLIFQEIFHFL